MRRTFTALAALLCSLSVSGEDTAGAIDGKALRGILAPAGDVTARVGRELAAFDADFSGELEAREFSKWVTQLRLQQQVAAGAASDENAARAWAAEAFKTADSDGSGGVNPGEMIAFLGGA